MTEQALYQLLSRYPDLELAFLFGSMATGRANAESDLDVAVQFDTPLSADLKQQLICDLARLSGRPVDLIDLRKAGEPLLGQVLKGKRVYGSTRAHGELLARHLRDVADFLPLLERGLKRRREKWINS